MQESDYERVIQELDELIHDTKELIERFEATGMKGQMQVDYDRLLAIHDQAVKDQRAHTLTMLNDHP
ncbi:MULTISPECIES: hypothetical protein [Halomonadaceae]|uniref:hypothetical protein n=1 Tax=Halomonadaceae TaxID=28256 RepID=UPI0015824E9F|nr:MULTISPECIES: hypothetical protein [Halomonas]MDI4637801.1 hypothetical protein [Halomonas sp. BMC7]NUJ58822.1 hypothetical protein [Halomonas taeanensis]